MRESHFLDMLRFFRAKNYRSIVDATLDLCYGEGKAPNGYREMESIPFFEDANLKMRVVPALALYGANASGKTNFVRALWAFQNLVINARMETLGANRLHPELETTRFEINFIKNGREYFYAIEYSQERGIKNEILKEGETVVFEISNSELVYSEAVETGLYPREKLIGILKVECKNDKLIQNVSFLSKIARNYPGLNLHISQAFAFIEQDIISCPVNKFHAGEIFDRLSEILPTEDDALKKVEALIKRMDFGIKRIEVDKRIVQITEHGIIGDAKNEIPLFPPRKIEGNKAVFDYFHSFHTDTHGKEVRFNFTEESVGTQVALGLFAFLLYVLKTGRVVFIDELDDSIHSLVFREVVRLFKDKNYNTGNAQIIFTAHNTDLLDSNVLRVSEVGIVNKTLKAGTTLTRLVEFDGIRNVTDFRHRYLNGEFSGIPFPSI